MGADKKTVAIIACANGVSSSEVERLINDLNKKEISTIKAMPITNTLMDDVTPPKCFIDKERHQQQGPIRKRGKGKYRRYNR